MQSQQFHLPDPRIFPVYDGAPPNPLIDLALASLAAELGVIQEKRDTELRELLAQYLVINEVTVIADALARSPSLAVQRHITRVLALAHVEAGRSRGDAGLPTTVFAIPLVIVAGNPTAVNVPPTSYPVAKIRLTLNLAAVPGWKQIDAVQLVAAP